MNRTANTFYNCVYEIVRCGGRLAPPLSFRLFSDGAEKGGGDDGFWRRGDFGVSNPWSQPE